MCITLATSYKLSEQDFKKFWLILSKDAFVCSDNLSIILKISEKNSIEEDSISTFSGAKIDFDAIEDLSRTVSFFGERLIVIKDFDITAIADADVDRLCDVIENAENTHFALTLTYDDDKKISAKKYSRITELAKKEGIYHLVKDIDEKYLCDMIISKAKELDTILSKEVAKIIVQNVGKNVGLLIHETEKYAAACNYTTIEIELVNTIGTKTLEASVFDIIDLICAKKPVKAIETLNKLFYMEADEVAIVGALSSSFVDMHRCKLAQAKDLGYTVVHGDFEKSSNPYRYQKAMSNSGKFSLNGLEGILKLLLDTDIALKSSNTNKKQSLSVLVTQIIAKGID